MEGKGMKARGRTMQCREEVKYWNTYTQKTTLTGRQRNKRKDGVIDSA
jgi:hypothetical protein